MRKEFWMPIMFAAILLGVLAGTYGGDNVLARIKTEPLPLISPHEHSRANAPDDPGHGMWSYGRIAVEEDTWITSFSVAVRSVPAAPAAEAANPVHSFMITKVGVPDTWCSDEDDRIFVSGNGIFRQQGGVAAFTAPGAIFVPGGTTLELSVLWHNHTDVLYRDARASVAIVGMRAPQNDARFRGIKLLGLTPAGCTGRMVGHVEIPPQSRDYKLAESHPLVIPADGAIVHASGHFHPDDGGKTMRLFLNGEPIYEISPVPGLRQRDFRKRLEHPIGVHKGDALTMEAVYDNPRNIPDRNAMAIMGVVLVESASPFLP